MSFNILHLFSLLVCCFSLANTLECKKCSGGKECCSGKIETTFTCPEDENSCYEEYIRHDGKVPEIRRGCAPSDWCTTQKKNHGGALKFCKTCQDAKCNIDIMTACENFLECITCDGSLKSPCQMGTANSYSTCPADEQSCYEEYIQNSGQPPLYRRGCGLQDRCTTSAQGNVRGKRLKYCRTCQGDKCNKKTIEALECKKCSGGEECCSAKIESTETCPQEYNSCYEEYIHPTGKDPVMQRGCAPSDWCTTQKNNHGDALKSCKTCQDAKCNTDVMLPCDPTAFKCWSCKKSEEETFDECREGKTQNMETVYCKTGEICYSYRLHEQWSNWATSGVKLWYIRGCSADTDFCRRSNYHSCQRCTWDKCNDHRIILLRSGK